MDTGSKTMMVSTAGCCLAMVTAQQLTNQRDGHGLLFGAVSKDHMDVVNDTGSNTVTRTVVDIQAFSEIDVHGKDGSIDKAQILAAEERLNLKMVGWFTFRSNTPLRPSMREIQRHGKIEALFSEERDRGAPMLLVILSTSGAQNGSTQSFDHRVVFRQSGRDKLRSVDLVITNLRHSSHTEYSAFTACARINSAALCKELSVVPPPMVQKLEEFAVAKQEELQQLLRLVADKAQEELDLCTEVERLRLEMAKLREAEKAAM